MQKLQYEPFGQMQIRTGTSVRRNSQLFVDTSAPARQAVEIRAHKDLHTRNQLHDEHGLAIGKLEGKPD